MFQRIEIRIFQSRDLRSILRIENESFGENAWPRELFVEYARESPDLFLVAAAGNRIAGYSTARFARGVVELASIAVLPRYRERGAATLLLKATIQKARRRKAQAIWLMVRPDNEAAVAFYRKSGFVRVSTVSKYYEDGSPGWRMKLSLKRSA